MIVADLMTPLAAPLTPNDTLRQAAAALHDARLDLLPVCHDGHVIGAVSEHDLVDHGLARGLNTDSPVFAVMSHYFDWCYDDDPVRDIAARLSDADLESLVVMTRDHRLAGIVTASALTPTPRVPLAGTGYAQAA